MKTHVIDGKTYVEVVRKAKVGEKVIATKQWYDVNVGTILEVIDGRRFGFSNKNGYAHYNHPSNCFSSIRRIKDEFYHVLEPVADEKPELDDLLSQCKPESRHEEWPVELTANDVRWQPDKVIDLLANLARRVSSLERQVESLSTQLTDTQRNVERQGVEIAEIKHLTESNEEDIRLLDNRSQVINAIQKYYDGGDR